MDIKKVPIILRFKLSALPAAKITSEIKKVETKINKLSKEGKSDDEVLKALGDIDKLANKILESNNAKINEVKKPVKKEATEEMPKEEPVLKIPKKELDENEKKVLEMKERLKKSMNSTTGVSKVDQETGETTEERVSAKEFTKELIDNQVEDKSAHTFISATKNDKALIAKAISGWIFIGSWALPLFELMHLLVLSSPFFILYAIIQVSFFGVGFATLEGATIMMLALALSCIGPVLFYYMSKPFLFISSKLFAITSKLVDTNMTINQKNNPFMFVLNHKRLLHTMYAIAILAIGLVILFSQMSDYSLAEILNNNF